MPTDARYLKQSSVTLVCELLKFTDKEADQRQAFGQSLVKNLGDLAQMVEQRDAKIGRLENDLLQKNGVIQGQRGRFEEVAAKCSCGAATGERAAVHTTPVLPLSDEAPETKRCQYCGQGFAVLRAGHIFCGEKCRERATIAAQVEALSARIGAPVTSRPLVYARCKTCGHEFDPALGGPLYCSPPCFEASKEAVPEPIEEPVTAKIKTRPEPDKLAAELWAEAGLDAEGVSDALMWGDGAGSDGAVRS
jgi:hypothetical protein